MKQVLDDTLSRIAGAKDYHEQALEFGERAWRVIGKFADFIYWDVGNGWYDIIKLIPKKGHEERLQRLFEEIENSSDF